MSYQTILFHAADRVATVTINRPEKLNALNVLAKSELLDVFGGLGKDDAIDCVILTGAGEKAFVAGTDIQELEGLDASTGAEFAARGQALFNTIEELDRPVIAAVNGYALGGGCELALACHIRIASERAKFGQPEVGLGIIPGYGGTQRLARIIGEGRAMEMILGGIQIDAAEALRAGLVSRVFPPEELMARATTFARVIAGNSRSAVRNALRAVQVSRDASLREGLAAEASLFADCCGTHDFSEGVKAFLEKRKPHFIGK